MIRVGPSRPYSLWLLVILGVVLIVVAKFLEQPLIRWYTATLRGEEEILARLAELRTQEALEKQLAQIHARDCATYSKYLELEEGFSYESVSRLIGRRGEEMSRSGELVTYHWPGTIPGSGMTATFERGRLVAKAQVGLR